MVARRKHCDACRRDVASSWLARHVASGCRVAPGLRPPAPRWWLDEGLRARPLATLERDADYYGVRTLRPRKKRRFEPVD